MRKGIIYVYFNRAKYEKEGVEKYYVGQTVRTAEQRARKYGRGYGYTDPNCNTKFAKSIRKWGWDAFEGRILEEVYEEDLNELEKFYIEQFDSYKNGYNSTLGGEGTRGRNPFANKTEEEMKEIKEKMSKSQSVVVKKYWKNQEYRKKQSIARRKCWEDKEKRKKLGKKISIINKKRFQDKSEREKCSQPGELNPHARKVYCNTLNIVFSYIGLAEEYCINVLNSKIGRIGLVCDGKRKSTGTYNGKKLHWNWIENIDKETLNNAEYIDSKKYEEIINERKKCGISCELNYYATSVYCEELNIIFSYTKLAKKYCINILNSKIGLISDVCDGKAKSTGEYNGTKLTWSWTKNLDKEILNKAEFIDSEKYEKIINERKKYGIPRELNYYATSVYCNELNILFSHIRLATEYCKNVLNIKIGRIDRTCNSKAKYSGKLSNGTKLTWSWTKNLNKEILNNAIYIDNKKYEEIINAKNK